MMGMAVARTAFALWIVSVALNAFSYASAEGAAARNFILITVDTLRADRLGSYHYEGAKTPALDALAAESILFENAFAHASITLRSLGPST